MILILTATTMEQQSCRSTILKANHRVIAHRNVTEGHIGNRKVALLETGIGAVNTAQALTGALETLRPNFVLQTGIGGAYLTSGLDIGDIALATDENYGDLGVLTPNGWHSAEEIGIPVLRKDRDYYNRFELDSNLVSQAHITVNKINWGITAPTVISGPFVTVQQCTGVSSKGNELAARFGGICENMEGAAAAHLCALYNVPFIELRAISNRVEDRNFDTWDVTLAAYRAQKATGKIIKNIEL